MDVDRLQRLSGIVKKCIQFQEVTEAAELMDASKVTLNVHYTAAGEHNPNPNVIPRTYTGYMASTQAIRDGQSLHYPAIPVLPRESANRTGMGTAGTVLSVASASSATPPAGVAARIPTLPPLQVDVMSPCQRVKGLVPVSEHTFEIYKWMQRGKDISDPKVHVEVRRARKEATASLNGTRRGNGQPTSPRSTAQSATALDEVGDERQFLSVVVVLYGRVNFLLQDEMYFREDGALVLIDRFLLQPVDVSSPQFISDRNSFFKLGRSQIQQSMDKHPVVDFSFKGLRDTIDALKVSPVSGAPHVARPVFKPPTQERNAEAVTFASATEGLTGPTRKLIVAKNRKGEEEAYEFEIKAVLRADAEEKQSEDDLMMQQLAARLSSKYDAEVVRLCNNNITNAMNMVQVLRNLIANHFLTVQWIDLSNNQLTTIPDLTSLPLKTLYLHANKISDWQVIENRVCILPQLTSVTCHGNPIATTDKDYKQQLLMRVQRAKAKITNALPIKLVDFVSVSACDTHVASMYSQFTQGGSVPLHSMKASTVDGNRRGSPRTPRRGGDEIVISTTRDSPRSSSMVSNSPRRQ